MSGSSVSAFGPSRRLETADIKASAFFLIFSSKILPLLLKNDCFLKLSNGAKDLCIFLTTTSKSPLEA